MPKWVRKILCFFGWHIEYFKTWNMTKGSICFCGKKETPPIIWPHIAAPPCKPLQKTQEAMGNG